MALRFCCIVGSTREGRMADRVLKLVQNQFDTVLKPKGHTLQVIGKL